MKTYSRLVITFVLATLGASCMPSSVSVDSVESEVLYCAAQPMNVWAWYADRDSGEIIPTTPLSVLDEGEALELLAVSGYHGGCLWQQVRRGPTIGVARFSCDFTDFFYPCSGDGMPLAPPQSICIDVPFISQQPNGAACAAASLAMGLSYLCEPSSMADVYAWLDRNGYTNPVTGYVDNNGLDAAAAHFSDGRASVDFVTGDDDCSDGICLTLDYLREQLANNVVPIAAVNSSELPDYQDQGNALHSIVITGVDEDAVYYHNPWWQEGPYAMSAAELWNAMPALEDANAEPIANSSRHFLLVSGTTSCERTPQPCR